MRILDTIALTDNQKRVMAKITAAPTPHVAAVQISQEQNLVAATNQLMKLGLIVYNGGQASLTDQGTTVAKQENVVDETGSLTPDGEKLAYTDAEGNPDEDAPPTETKPPGAPGLFGPLESVQYKNGSLLRELLKR